MTNHFETKSFNFSGLDCYTTNEYETHHFPRYHSGGDQRTHAQSQVCQPMTNTWGTPIYVSRDTTAEVKDKQPPNIR